MFEEILPVPIVKINVDLNRLINEACLKQEGFSFLGVPTEQQDMSHPRLFRWKIFDGIDILNFVNLYMKWTVV